MIPPSAPTPVDDDATGRKNMQQLIQLRWIAVLGQVGTILVVYFVFRIELPLLYMFAVLAGLVAFNGASLLRLREHRRRRGARLVELALSRLKGARRGPVVSD